MLYIISYWTDNNTSPNIAFKIVFYLCLLLPALIKASEFVPTLIIGFSGIALYGFAYSYMPTYLPVYLGSLFIFYLLFIRTSKNQFKVPKRFIGLGIYTLFIDLITNLQPDNITYSIFIVGIMGLFLDKYISKETMAKLSFAFSLCTIVLSMYFLLFQDMFTRDYYAQGSGLERIGWMDANYFGMVVGMGLVTAIIELTKFKDLGIIEKNFYIATLIFSLPTLILNASRGAILAVCISFTIIVIFSKMGRSLKTLIIFATVAFLIYLYNNNYFELLAYRINNDSNGGSGRTEIWVKKLSAFFEGDKLLWLIGYGNVGGKELGMGWAFGSHNDYVAILCAYGAIGLLFFISMLLYPIIKLKKRATGRPLVLAAFAYILTMCFTLEPYTAGRLSYFFFYFYVLVLMQAANNQEL